jgi:MHS family proline/betaine transporter-like MFS transporter
LAHPGGDITGFVNFEHSIGGKWLALFISAALTASQASLSAARRRAGTIGNGLEWYDFLIYGFLAMTIAKLFFPAENELTSLLLSVGTFGAAAVVRPVASVVLGILGSWEV